MRRRGARSTGFTILELAVVVVIIGMAASAVSVAWQAVIPRTKLNTAVRNLASVLWDTRSEAIARNSEFELHYQIDENRYWVVTPYRAGGVGGVASKNDERLFVSQHNLPEGVTIARVTIDGIEYEDGEVFVRFTPLGNASGHTVVFYQEIFERFYTIEVLALTGLIRFHDDIFIREVPREGDFN